MAATKAQIIIDKLTYGYDREHPVLKNISLEIFKGECVAISARTGRAKPPWPSI
jgi:ABC-type multidrug transport system fused ATPase/permease subunit